MAKRLIPPPGYYTATPMTGIGDAFSYPFRDPRWPEKMILQALILLIPVVGWIATWGWLMLAYVNLRAGRMELPAAGFHLRSGFSLFVVSLIYTIVIYGVPVGLLYAFGHTLSTQTVCYGGRYSYVCRIPPTAFAANFYPLSGLAILVINFLIPSIVVNTFERGIGGGLNVSRIVRAAALNRSAWLLTGITSALASILGGLGVCGCCIGLLFTLVYQYAVQAGLAAWLGAGISQYAGSDAQPN